MSAAVICAVNWLLLTNVVARSLPLKRTTELLLKLAPLAVSVKAASPAVSLAGEMPVSVGAGLLTVNSIVPEVPPPGVGLKTATGNVPAVCKSAPVIWALNSVALTKVVGRLLPFQSTTELATKLAPLTVKTNAASPAVLLAGESVLTVAMGLLTMKLSAVVVPPPGAGLNTVIGNMPAV